MFLIAWIGWALDATDFGLFSIVLRPALTELLGGQPTVAELGEVGGYLSMVGLLGWAFGGFLFGIIADYIGRVRTLALSILVFSVFTACQGFAQTPLQLGIFRFLAGLGTGAEIVVGIPLVAEAFAEHHRAKILGVMMTGGAFGSIIGGQVYNLVGPYGWRYVFFVGIAPALLLLFIRRSMGEPAHFQAVRERRAAVKAAGARGQRARPASSCASCRRSSSRRELRFSTFVGLLFCLGTLLSIWTSDDLAADHPDAACCRRTASPGAAAIPYVGNGMMLWGIGGMFGYATFGFLADRVRPQADDRVLQRRRASRAGWCSISASAPTPTTPICWSSSAISCSASSRATRSICPSCSRPTCARRRSSFCNGTGRIITSFGPLVAGLLVVPFGSFNNAAAFMTCFAVLSIIAMMIGRETSDDALPS